MQNILFVPSSATSFRELLIVAKYLSRQSDYKPIFLLQDSKSTNARMLDDEHISYEWVYSNQGSQVSKESSSARRLAAIWSQKDVFKRKAVSYLVHDCVYSLAPVMWLQSVPLSRKIKRDLVRAKEICSDYCPVALLLADDRTLGFHMAMMATCSSLNIPVILVPVGYSDPVGSARLREGKRQYQASGLFAPLLNKRLARRFPQQLFRSKGTDLMFYPGGVAKALAQYGMLQGNPWVMGGVGSACVAVDGPETRERYIGYGIQPQRISVVGQPSSDELYAGWVRREYLRKELRERYRLAPQRKLLICAVPQLGEHNILPWDQHWAEIHFLVETLCDTKQNVLLSLHPKSDHSQYVFLENEYGCTLTRDPLNKILPAADIFVATFSSTIRWAVVCEIPSIVVDFYGLNYTIYDDLAGVIKATQRTEFRAVLERLVGDGAYYQTLKEEQQRVKNLVLTFDGWSCKRILTLVETFSYQ